MLWRSSQFFACGAAFFVYPCLGHAVMFHRRVEMGRALWVHLAQTLTKWEHPEKNALAHIWVSFEVIQRGDSAAPLGSLCQGFVTCINTEVLLGIQREHPVFRFAPVSLVQVLGTTKKSLPHLH